MRARCEAQVVDKGSTFHRTHQCKNPAKVTRKGKSFCGQHDPKERAKRSAAADRFFLDKQNARRRDLENQRIGVAVRKLFRDDADLEQIMAWVQGEQKRRQA